MRIITSVAGNSIKLPTAINESHNGRKSATIGETSAPTYYWTAKRGDKKALRADGQLRALDLVRYVGIGFADGMVCAICMLSSGHYYTKRAPASFLSSIGA